MEDSSSDSISLDSTVESEQEDQYNVKEIVAQENIDGVDKYLVLWEGYPDSRATFEPEESFLQSDTMREVSKHWV